MHLCFNSRHGNFNQRQTIAGIQVNVFCMGCDRNNENKEEYAARKKVQHGRALQESPTVCHKNERSCYYIFECNVSHMPATQTAITESRPRKGVRTRESILRVAVDLASVEGLEGLTIGRLARELEMSKSGLFAHFGSKEELQVATVRAAAAIFVARVIRGPVEDHEPGIARLLMLLDRWLDYMERGTFAGGCFFAAATVEMDGRPGPVRDAVANQISSWARLLADYAGDAIARGELREDTDP